MGAIQDTNTVERESSQDLRYEKGVSRNTGTEDACMAQKFSPAKANKGAGSTGRDLKSRYEYIEKDIT